MQTGKQAVGVLEQSQVSHEYDCSGSISIDYLPPDNISGSVGLADVSRSIEMIDNVSGSVGLADSIVRARDLGVKGAPQNISLAGSGMSRFLEKDSQKAMNQGDAFGHKLRPYEIYVVCDQLVDGLGVALIDTGVKCQWFEKLH